jgi:hypothetical protein
MGRTRLRLGAWALAVLTSFALFGEHTAFAASNGPRVEGAGWFNIFCGFSCIGQEVKFGITANNNGVPQGRFDYYNTVTGLTARGKITAWTPHQNTACAGPPATAPAATLSGSCDDGSNCTFQMDVVDSGSPGKGNDYICNVQVTGGHSKNGAPSNDSDPNSEPLFHGNINIPTQ